MNATAPEIEFEHAEAGVARQGALQRALGSWSVRIGGASLALLVLASLLAPWLATADPTLLDPINRDLLPGARATMTLLSGETVPHVFHMGSDAYGRDIYSRLLHGGRVSLVVGVAVAVLSLCAGMVLGLFAGYLRRLDLILMRLMDGLMAIPGILLAVSLVALWRASLVSVIAALAIPEVPRVVRLVRSLVLSIREEPYVEAAISIGTLTTPLLFRHVLPNTLAPLIVQATYVCGSAILGEAILGFLGMGLPPLVPTWGNMMAEGRLQFNQYPHNVFFPGVFLTITVLAVNLLGDGLRDTLDPRFSRRGWR